MQIKILDSWLREYLKTDAKPQEIAKVLSLSSVSVERLEKHDNDWLYDIEVTTNRVDLMSIDGLAQEATAALTESGVKADFKELSSQKINEKKGFPIKIVNNQELVKRVCAVVMDVKVGNSPAKISKRLEASGIRSLNNVIDVTNYAMRETGHPSHVFDFDRLNTNTLKIRASKKGEKIVTLDNKEYSLPGEDIVMENDEGTIVDLLGIMGLANSVVSEDTKRILFFIDNNEPKHIRNTSMSLGIRTEAAVINEKGVDPELAMEALKRGIKLYEEFADGVVVSEILDIYPNKTSNKKITLSLNKVNKIIGEDIPKEKSKNILIKLGFKVEDSGDKLIVTPPSFRGNDISIEEDLIEEIARIYGYHNLKPILPPQNQNQKYVKYDDEFYWEERVKSSLKYWGLTEAYTYSLIPEDLYQGPAEDGIKLKNPLSSDMVFLRNSIIPSLIKVSEENKTVDKLKIFELSNTYHTRPGKLPIERLTLSALFREKNLSFFEIKGLIEGLMKDLGIEKITYKPKRDTGNGSEIYVQDEYIGYIEALTVNMVDFELDFNKLVRHATLKRKYNGIAKFPPIVEDISIEFEKEESVSEITEAIKKVSELISEVRLLDEFDNKKTFHVVYQSFEKTLTKPEAATIRNKIQETLADRFKAKII